MRRISGIPGALLERVGQNMRGMNTQAQKLYAQRMGIDPSLIPALTQDVSALKAEFAAMYGVAGRNARQAAEDSMAFLAELDKLGSMCGPAGKVAQCGLCRPDAPGYRGVPAYHHGKFRGNQKAL